jgi:hypothetical protein
LLGVGMAWTEEEVVVVARMREMVAALVCSL